MWVVLYIADLMYFDSSKGRDFVNNTQDRFFNLTNFLLSYQHQGYCFQLREEKTQDVICNNYWLLSLIAPIAAE
jgi:prenyltransferase beta subunit